MLSKLLKYEFRYTGRIVFLLYAGLAILAVLCRGLWDLTNHLDLNMLAAPAVMALILFILACTATLLLPYILSVVRFFKNMVGDEGYLTFTLPVPTAYHILAKLICGLCFMLFSLLCVILCVGILVLNPEIWDKARELWNQLSATLSAVGMQDRVWVFVLETCGLLLTSTLSGLSMLYAAMSVGQLMKGHKIVGSVLAYLGLDFVFQTVSGFFAALVTLTPLLRGIRQNTPFAEAEIVNTSVLMSMILQLIFSAVCFFLTERMLSKKLNLD